MPVLTRRCISRPASQFADAVIRQITQTQADNQIVTSALQAAMTAVQASTPGAQIVYGTFSYQSAAGNGCAVLT